MSWSATTQTCLSMAGFLYHTRGLGKYISAAMSNVLYWFRTDLRLHDSPALQAALSIDDIKTMRFIWNFDPYYVKSGIRVGVNRFNFLLESMKDIDQSLRKLNQRLLVLRGDPLDNLPKIIKHWKITDLVFEADRNEYGHQRDLKVKEILKDVVKVHEVFGHSVWDPIEVMKKNGNKPTMSIVQLQKAISQLPEPPRPIEAPSKLPHHGDLSLPDLSNNYDDRVDRAEQVRVSERTVYEEQQDFSIPTLESLGYPKPTTSIKGGETEGLRRLELFCKDKKAVWEFKKPQTAPTQFDPPATTLLSPYYHFGCLGSRKVWYAFKDILEEEAKKRKTKLGAPKEDLLGQCQFREMYHCSEYGVPNFSQSRGNPYFRYVPWDLPNAYDKDGEVIFPRPKGDARAEEWLDRWTHGQTGFPWIDALMRQLKEEGWIHHLGRHSVACFLTRGQMYISWERGAEVFAEYLLDHDPASNAGNWAWLSSTCFSSTYYRVYGTESFPKKWDKSGALVRKYCPELKSFPDQYIYCPSQAPLEVQKKANCIVGKDYPAPILDEHYEKDRNIGRMKAAYQAGFYGDAPEVLNGTAAAKVEAMYDQPETKKAKTDG